MVKILFDLQISSYTPAGTALVSSDSNYLFTKAIINELVERGYECRIMMGESWIRDKIGFPNCQVDLIKYRGTEEDRYFMDPEIINVIHRSKPDIIWTNDPCRVGAYRSVFDGKIIAYNHWIDNPADPKMPLQKTYYFRQIEAAQKADLCLFNSRFGMQLFEDHVVGIRSERARLGVVNPPLNTALLSKYVDSSIKSTKPAILFNHRLSSAPQYKHNVDSLIIIMDQLDKVYGSDYYNVLVSNPSDKPHDIYSRSNVFHIGSSDYETYVKVAASAWVQFTMFKYPGQWSMALGEALALGIFCIYPPHSGYQEMVTKGGFSAMSALEAITYIHHIFTHSTASLRALQADHYLQMFSPEYIVETQLIPLLKDLE